jgi:hypothetical protein
MSEDIIVSIANIAANTGEIGGIFAGLRLIFGAIIIGATKVGRAKEWAITGLIVLVSGFALPGIVNWLGSMSMLSATIVGWLFAVPLLVFGFTTWWLPSVMCQQMKKDSMWVSVLCLVSVFVAPAWFLALFLAVRGKGQEAQPYCPAVPDILTVLLRKAKESMSPKTTTLGCGEPHDNSSNSN